MSANGLNLPQDPLDSDAERDVIEGEEEEVIEEFDSDSDSLSFSDLSEDEEEESDVVVPSTLTRNGQIRAVVRLDL